MSIKTLQDFTFTAKYSKYQPEKKRRETWKEAVQRSRQMMLDKYQEYGIDDEINWAYDLVEQKKVVGSQRTLQFAGTPIWKHHARGYNCSASYVDRLRFFQECMYLLLCGCGTGFSVQKHHVAKLPPLLKEKSGEKTFVIPDSIEGWSDAIGILVSSYFDGDIWTEYKGYHIRFDGSQIRPEGSRINSFNGKAPGPAKLLKSLEHIRDLMDRCLEAQEFRTIDAYDIIMYSADAVVAGGSRRSATICFFSEDDEYMLNAKTGDWFYKNPQRGRSNNTVPLLKDKTTFEQFNNIVQHTRYNGEPAFSWIPNYESIGNPCGPSSTTVITPNGISTFGNLSVGDLIWSETGWTKVLNKWSNGIKPVYKYKTTTGFWLGTSNHRIIQKGIKVEVGKAESIDQLSGPYSTSIILDEQTIMDGLVLGDGSRTASTQILNIGDNDQDYFQSEIKHLISRKSGHKQYYIYTSITDNELVPTYERKVPDRFKFGTPSIVCSFLRGLYSANGSYCGGRITLKQTSFQIIEDVQLMLSSLGIKSYYTTNKPSMVKFANGDYLCKQSYDLNITTDKDKFIKLIGFIQKYKNDKIKLNKSGKGKTTFDIHTIEFIGEEEVWDITVDNEPHTYWSGGLNVSNCNEISFFCYDIENKELFSKHNEDKIECQPEQIGLKSGWQMCNLSSINCKKVKTEEDFYKAAKAAAIIGTLQAGFTKFTYLGKTTENIVRREALLGVSMTGMMESPDICLKPEIQQKAAELIKEINKDIANKIAINPAARTTCVKPEGSSSCVLGTSSGIHPHHAKRYIRRVQTNKNCVVYGHFKKVNPKACEESVWSNNKSDDVISFCVEVPDGSKTKNQVSAIELLKYVQSTQTNWIKYGKNEELCTQPYLTHNVSNTIHVKPHEWEEVIKFIYDNRQDFCGVSLLSITGDKDYQQAPFTTIYLPSEISRHYGDGSILVSGLIERALELFDDNLWTACDAAIGLTKVNSRAKQEWCRKVTNFANKYMGGDIKKLTYCMKDVYNYKYWLDLNREYKDVDYETLIEEEDNTNLQGEMACSGGQCEII